MADLEIFGIPQSNFVWVTRIAAAEKGVTATVLPLPPHAPEVSAIHPFGKVPAMRHGDFTLCESSAICRYIDAAFDGPSLTFADPKLAAKLEQWIALAVTSIDRAVVRDYLIPIFFPGDAGPDRARIDAALPAMEKALTALESAVGDGYLVGGRFTLADAYVTPILYYAAMAPESGAIIQKSPALTSYLAKQMAHPSVRDTVPPPFPSN